MFRDRHDAGRRLADHLTAYQARGDLLVLGLPRGGIPVAYEVARRLRAPLDAFLVRKLGVPGQEELAFGALAADDVLVLNDDVIDDLRISRATIEAVARNERYELARRDLLYREGRPAPLIAGQTIILVDDGLATGATMRAAVMALQQHHPTSIVIAVPVAAPSTCAAFTSLVDDVVAVIMPESFYAVGTWYDDFTPTSDDEVRSLLRNDA